jgi:hypothetical protein
MCGSAGSTGTARERRAWARAGVHVVGSAVLKRKLALAAGGKDAEVDLDQLAEAEQLWPS